jgi:hypothetical protein
MRDSAHLVLALIAGVVTGTLLIGLWRAWIRERLESSAQWAAREALKRATD